MTFTSIIWCTSPILYGLMRDYNPPRSAELIGTTNWSHIQRCLPLCAVCLPACLPARPDWPDWPILAVCTYYVVSLGYMSVPIQPQSDMHEEDNPSESQPILNPYWVRLALNIHHTHHIIIHVLDTSADFNQV